MNDAITIYCGSCPGNRPDYIAAAEAVGREVARRGLSLVSGGGSMGMMGAAAAAARAAGGRDIAVIPQFMVDRGWNDPDASRTVITASMHERKATMAAMARGVIALPGGIGTLEELFEIITWRQLGLFSGNIVVLNTAGYYDPLAALLDNCVSAGFLPADHRRLWQLAADPVEAVSLAAVMPSDLHLNPKF